MNKENLYKSILKEATQNAYKVYKNYGFVYSEKRILHEVEMAYKLRISKLEYQLKSTQEETKEEKQARIAEQKKKKAKEERLKLYKLDPDNNEDDRNLYEEIRFTWFFEEEGDGSKKRGVNKLTGQKYTSGNVYKDSKGRRAVGIGFDMEQSSSRQEWRNAFGDNALDFDEVFNGKRNLTEQEMRTLFNHSVSSREQRLKRYIGQENWQKLKPNERLALESANYNGVVGPELKRRISEYAKTGKREDLDSAFRELASNESVGKPYLDQELQPRREGEAELLASHHDKENYIEPALARQMEEAFKKAQVSIGQQVPNNIRTNQPYKDGDYFIWQHRSLKPNPNPLHLKENEVSFKERSDAEDDGRIYKVGSDQWGWLTSEKWKGCMCIAEQVDYSKIEVL